MSTNSETGGRKLSVAMIVRDAGDGLTETLQSIRSIADEIVVLDTGSTDDTTAVARRHGAVVIERAWQDDFADARNRCLSHVTGDWLLWLDAGERLTAESAAELREFVLDQADPAKAYMMLVRVPASMPGASAEQVGRIRLMPRRDDLRFEGRVREQVKFSIEAAGLTVEGLPWRILRGRREHDAQRKARKARRDLELVELTIRENGPQARQLVAKGEALAALGKDGEAAAAFQQAIASADCASPEMLEAYYGLLTTFDGDARRQQNQLTTCLAALEVFPLDVQLLCAMGNYLQALGHVDMASRSFGLAHQHGQIHPEAWHLCDIAEIAASCYSLALQLQGEDDKALDVLEQGLQQNESSTRLRRSLLTLHVKHGRRAEALDQAGQLGPDLPHREAFQTAVRGACLAAKKTWAAARPYLETAYEAGCRDPLCLRAYAVTLLSTGQWEAAEPILHEWCEREPRDAEVRKYIDAIEALRAERAREDTGETGVSAKDGAAADSPAEPTAREAEDAARRIRVDNKATPAANAVPGPVVGGDVPAEGAVDTASQS